MKKFNIKVFLLICILVLIDQFIKIVIIKNIVFNSDIILIQDFLNLTYITNTGAALGLLNGNVLLLSLISSILIFYLFNELKNNNNNKLQILSLIIIISGSMGNLIDRLFRGFVVDYISFILFNKSMPVFNLADIFITIGTFILFLSIIKEGKNDNKN